MLARTRSFVAALTIAALITGLGAPALAAGFGTNDETAAYEASVPVVLDVLVLRPIGLLMTTAGLIVYAFPVLPFTAVTRPTQIWKPFGPLVATPARYTFSDPLGSHPIDQERIANQ
jgi:hypothetical protein